MATTDPTAQAVERIYKTVTQSWGTQVFPDAEGLRGLLATAVAQAQTANPEIIPVAGATLRPMMLRLAVLATDCSADAMYGLEWTEWSVASDGQAYLVFRRRDGQHYASPWGNASVAPEGLARAFPPLLALALMGGPS